VFDIAIFIFLVVMSIRVISASSREAEIFREFNQSRLLALLSLLFPLAPLVMLFGLSKLGLVVSDVLAVLCLAPGLIVARRNMRAFERSGTDRVTGAIDVASQAITAAIAGLVYVAAVAILVLTWASYATTSGV
jgi:hypothetical protein